MSTSGFSADDQPDQIEYYCIPKKFVFDVPEKHKDLTKRRAAMKRTLEAEKTMPFVFTFPEPDNYKESYSHIVKQIASMYNHARLLVVGDHYEELKHVIGQPKLEQPGDCLGLLKDLFTACCEKLKAKAKDGSETDDSDSVKNYEELLQKAEAKIRTLIRNEQIFRLNFEVISQRWEDTDKALQATTLELETSKRAQEKLMKEVQELTSKVWQRDDEIKKMNKDKEVERRAKGISNTVVSVSNSIQAGINELKNPVPTLNQQILSVLFTDGKYSSNENTTKAPSSVEGKGRSEKRHNSDRLIATERAKNDKKSTLENGDKVNENSASSNKVQVEKLKDSLVSSFKKHMTESLATNGKKTVLNTSLEAMRNKSAEYSLSQSRDRINGPISTEKKRNSQQIKMSQLHEQQVRQKPPKKERKLGEYSERELYSYAGNKPTVQKLMNPGKYSVNSSRPISTGKSRDSPFMSRSRTVQTEQSPENRSQDSKVLHAYATNPSADMISGAYYGTYGSKKSGEMKESRSQSKGTVKSSSYIKSMIAEHLIKRIGAKAV